jgi:hypothetical protein
MTAPHPQPEYIITEELLEQISTRCIHLEFDDCFKCPYYRTHKDCPTNLKELKSQVRSRLYSSTVSEREKRTIDNIIPEVDAICFMANSNDKKGIARAILSERDEVLEQVYGRLKTACWHKTSWEIIEGVFNELRQQGGRE